MINEINHKIGVVVVTFNSEIFLNEFFKSIEKQTFTNYNLYFIDNYSSDNSLDKINDWEVGNKKVISNDKNFGIAKANNQGIQLALEDKCRYVLLINDDTSFPPDCFEKLLNGLNDNDADLVAPITYYFDDPTKIWSAGGYFNNFFKSEVKHYGINQKNSVKFSKVRKITYAPTSCLLFKSSLINEIGIMDEKYFIYVDDVDFCYRATIINKKKMLCIPNISFLHKVNGHSEKSTNQFKSDFFIKYTIRNTVYFCLKFLDYRKAMFLIIYFFKINLKVLLQKDYKRSFWSFITVNKYYFKGFFSRGTIESN